MATIPTKKKKAAAKKAAPAKRARKKNRAEVEFERYKARTAPQAAMGTMSGSFPPATDMPQTAAYSHSFPLGGGTAPGWAFPPSLAVLPQAAGAAFATPGVAASGSLSDRLGVTLRLGIEVLNAGLTGGLHALGGLSSAASGLGALAWPHHGWDSHDCCCDPCATECGCYDCCCLMGCGCDCCCHPSVGNCCC